MGWGGEGRRGDENKSALLTADCWVEDSSEKALLIQFRNQPLALKTAGKVNLQHQKCKIS